ncbi:MAG TPA: hypothetical protein ACQGQI_04770 [Xylella sp.]
MSRFAYFNPTDGRVIQWIDTDAMSCNLPDASLRGLLINPKTGR